MAFLSRDEKHIQLIYTRRTKLAQSPELKIDLIQKNTGNFLAAVRQPAGKLPKLSDNDNKNYFDRGKPLFFP